MESKYYSYVCDMRAFSIPLITNKSLLGVCRMKQKCLYLLAKDNGGGKWMNLPAEGVS